MPKRVRGQAHQVLGLVSLPVTRASVNGFIVSDCLLDSGSQKSLIDSHLLKMIAPQAQLKPATALISASGHRMKALGICSLPVKIVAASGSEEVHFDFTVVEGLTHDCIFGWDFLKAHRMVMECSDVTGQVKLRLKKPVRVPPRSISCLCVRTDAELSTDSDYVLTGQRSDRIEITDALIRPYSSREIPLYVRNRSDRFVTLHRRDVIGYLQPTDGADITLPRDTGTPETAETNAVSASDGQFLGMESEDILARFQVGEEIKGSNREKVASLLQSFPDVFSQNYTDIGCYAGGDVDLEFEPGTRPRFSKPYPVPWAKEKVLEEQLNALQAGGVIAVGEPSDWNSPVILVPKGKSAELRIVQDMREINRSLLPKKFVLPSIDDFLQSLHGWKIASSLDIKHAFWNLNCPKSRKRSALFMPWGRHITHKECRWGVRSRHTSFM